jgi:hypothetical protein
MQYLFTLGNVEPNTVASLTEFNVKVFICLLNYIFELVSSKKSKRNFFKNLFFISETLVHMLEYKTEL